MGLFGFYGDVLIQYLSGVDGTEYNPGAILTRQSGCAVYPLGLGILPLLILDGIALPNFKTGVQLGVLLAVVTRSAFA